MTRTIPTPSLDAVATILGKEFVNDPNILLVGGEEGRGGGRGGHRNKR